LQNNETNILDQSFGLWSVGRSACGRYEPSPNALATPVAYEELPELKASDILKPDVLSGPHYKVREEVPTSSGANQFTIDSDFDVFEADEMKCSLGELMRSMQLRG